MNQVLIRLKYKLRYLWRSLIKFTGHCPDCYSPVNYTPSGRPICPECGR